MSLNLSYKKPYFTGITIIHKLQIKKFILLSDKNCKKVIQNSKNQMKATTIINSNKKIHKKNSNPVIILKKNLQA